MPGSTVGVVVTTHNYGRYLEACLRSLDGQTRLPDSVIIVDDASTDDTPEVLQRVVPTLTIADRVRVHRFAEGRGLAAALNYGFATSDTDLVAHVDADDQCLPRYVEALADALVQHPEASYAYPRMRLTGAELGVYRSPPFHVARLLFVGNYIPNVALLRRSAFQDSGGYRQLPTHIDWDFWLELLALGHTGVLVDEVLYEWYRHPEAMTHQSWHIRLRTRLMILWRHRRLVLMNAHRAVPWTAVAVLRRFGLTRERRSASGWLDS